MREQKEYAPGYMPWHRRPTNQEIVDRALVSLRAELRRIFASQNAGDGLEVGGG
jgi:hypothetical protein